VIFNCEKVVEVMIMRDIKKMV